MKFILILFIGMFTHSAFADSLFDDDVCPVLQNADSVASTAQFSVRVQDLAFGFSCQELRGITEASEYGKLIITSATAAALRDPVLAADLAAAGLTFANPAVLTVAFVGGLGILTLKIVLKTSLEDCDRQAQDDLRNSIMQELETKYGLHANQSNVPLEINH